MNAHQSEPYQPYLFPELQPLLPAAITVATGPISLPVEREFTFWRVLVHLTLFLATAVTTTLAGMIFPLIGLLEEPDGIALLARYMLSSPVPLINGIAFSFTLLIILGAHELGHYFACRYYKVKASLPYFIPFLPGIGIGTLGAFIRIRSAIRSRRALFDIGIAGPLAGFIFAVPASLIGLLFAQIKTTEATIDFNAPLLFTLINKAFSLPPFDAMQWNPIWFAAWVGLLATGLNLIPVGQLDGGHIVYSIFGHRAHRLIALLTFSAAIVIAFFGYWRYNWAGGFIYVALLTVMMFVRHPSLPDAAEPLGRGRQILALIALLVFIVSFMPVPVSIS